MNEKEIIFNILERKIDDFTRQNPLLSIFNQTVKNYLKNWLNPYLDFFFDNGKFDVDMAGKFVEDEMTRRLKEFKKEFKNAEDEQTYI